MRLDRRKAQLKALNNESFNAEAEEELRKVEAKIEELVVGMRKLGSSIRKLQTPYMVEFSASSYSYGGIEEKETKRRQMFLENRFEVDTFANGWDKYEDDPAFEELIVEARNALYYDESDPRIINIKRV